METLNLKSICNFYKTETIKNLIPQKRQGVHFWHSVGRDMTKKELSDRKRKFWGLNGDIKCIVLKFILMNKYLLPSVLGHFDLSPYMAVK